MLAAGCCGQGWEDDVLTLVLGWDPAPATGLLSSASWVLTAAGWMLTDASC